ncbi:MAG: cell wall hydrolase [Pseudomonadota bacterium]
MQDEREKGGSNVVWRRFTKMQARGIGAALLVSLIGAGFSAQALAPHDRRAVPAPRPQGYEADDHFPGALYYTAVDDDAAYQPGATGTAPLPEGDVPDIPVDTSIHAAAPFAPAGSAADRDRALQCLTDAIYYEAANEPDAGQRAVAQVVLNRVRHPAFPATVCGVVFQGSERRGCQFSFACDGAMARAPARAAWDRARKVAADALQGSVFAPVGLATHYHTYAVKPAWNRSLVMTGVFGAHFFHRWKGWWGTPAAFSQRYRGQEPLPGPHPAAEPTVVAPQVAAANAPAAGPSPSPAAHGATRPAKTDATPPDEIQPEWRQSGTVQPRYAADPQLPESTILDKWKDTGRPIR